MSGEEAHGQQAFCRGCRELFASVDGFDAHRIGGHCVLPEVVSLVLVDGAWRTPEDMVQFIKMAKARAARGANRAGSS